MIKKKKMYRIYSEDELWDKKKIDFIHGIWCTDNLDCENMSIKDAQSNSVCLSGNIFDESIKDCLIFTFLDAVNYGLEKDKFVKIEYEELVAECKIFNLVVCE